ncbi:MAG: transcriptional regulator [Planctomycetes bacterium GWF2_42_9]|nr:MAG: transcriptional regulator [Planctomycetes bacterium GWF2_42_9]
MKIEKKTSPETILLELGKRIANRRIEQGITQAQSAEQAGVGKRTIERIEAGGDIQLTTLIRLLGVLDLAGNLDQLIPEATPSPMEMLKNQARPRKRAVTKKPNKLKKPWKWGDEQ